MVDTPANRLIAALDVPSRVEAEALYTSLGGVPAMIKIGLELFLAEGRDLVQAFVARGARVMLDLKLHDIPETVRRAAEAVSSTGAEWLTVHAAGGAAMLEAAVRGAGKTRVLAVTVLTSMDTGDLIATACHASVHDVVLRRAELAAAAGCYGVVASPHELATLASFNGLVKVTPGVRPAGASRNDQKRVMSPSEARSAGADWVVVGRPLRDAPDPAAAARSIVEELG